MYVGAATRQPAADAWSFDLRSGRMRRAQLSVVPALVRVFDEILVNAADNRRRDAATSRIDVAFTDGAAAFGVEIRNNGAGLPVRKHATEG